MPRPKRKRFLASPPSIDGLKPFGVPMKNLEPVVLLFEEYEAIKLADYEGLSQLEAAKRMEVSRPTFTRVYEKARKSMAQSLVEGKALLIEGGNYYTTKCWYKCRHCKKVNVSVDAISNCPSCQSNRIIQLNER